MTAIEWTDRVWNPVVGCSRVSSGCEHCYAERVAHRGLTAAHKGLTVSGPKGPRWTGEVRCLPERLEEPLHWRKPQRVFVNSMSDLFHESVPGDFIDEVFAVMAACTHLTFQVLTKRPEAMRQWFVTAMDSEPTVRCSEFVRFGDGLWENGEKRIEWPLPNVWLGVSVENQATADERIPLLLQTPAAVRFVSYEPALGPVNLDVSRTPRAAADEITDEDDALGPPLGGIGGIDWVIVGGESGPGARPCDVEWIRSTVRQCREASVPAFVKQLGARPKGWCVSRLHDPEGDAAGEYDDDFCDAYESGEAGGCGDRCIVLDDRKGGDPAEWPADLRVREMPGGAAR